MLEIRHLRYDVTAENGGTMDILRDVSLTVEPGKLVVITGPNGGGKTTLAKTIMGLNQPTGGSIRWTWPKRGSATAFSSPPGLRG